MFEIATGLKAFNRYKNIKNLVIIKYLNDFYLFRNQVGRWLHLNCFIQMTFVTNYELSSLSEIADKTAGPNSSNAFEMLIFLGKLCVSEAAENRPEMTIIYMSLQNYISSSNLKRSNASTGIILFYFYCLITSKVKF